MIALSVPEIEGGSPERHGEGAEEEGLVLGYSSSWIHLHFLFEVHCAVQLLHLLVELHELP